MLTLLHMQLSSLTHTVQVLLWLAHQALTTHVCSIIQHSIQQATRPTCINNLFYFPPAPLHGSANQAHFGQRISSAPVSTPSLQPTGFFQNPPRRLLEASVPTHRALLNPQTYLLCSRQCHHAPTDNNFNMDRGASSHMSFNQGS